MSKKQKRTSSGTTRDKSAESASAKKPKRARANTRKRKTSSKKSAHRRLSERLARRLDDLARDIPYAAPLAEKLRQGWDEVTLGDIIIDAACMQAIKGNPTIIRTIWERAEGKLSDASDGEDEPHLIKTPLAIPTGTPKRTRRAKTPTGSSTEEGTCGASED